MNHPCLASCCQGLLLPVVKECQLGVIEAKLMKQRGLEVIDMQRVFFNRPAEFIRFSGVVDPLEITAGNRVLSTQVADARIEYVGDGYINEAQTMGWLQRFFLNISPF